MNAPDARIHTPAAERNRGPILDQLRRVLPPRGRLLEIAAGSGQHAVHCASALPGWVWLPTDPDPSALQSISAWQAEARLANLLPPQALDVMQQPWPVACPFDAVLAVNLIHIAPWACCRALMRGAAAVLRDDGLLITYGAVFVDGEPPASGNLAFDADLRARNPAWGVRTLAAVTGEAAAAGLVLDECVAMPANNRLLVFRRAGVKPSP
ncbi:MAG: DUF938 domain-containing protein [Burkholderiaceae bacterium]